MWKIPGFTSTRNSSDLQKFSINNLNVFKYKFWSIDFYNFSANILVHPELLKRIHFVLWVIIMVIPSMLCFPVS